MLSEIKQGFLDKVRGPVFPIPTPFMKDGRVDYESLRKYVKFLVQKGARTLMVTVGTSRFDVLTVEEMKRVNETVAETAKGKALTIVTTPSKGPTSQAIDFAQHAEAVGADGILAVFPDRYYSDEGVYQFFEEIAGSCAIGVLIHLMPIPPGKSGIGVKAHYSPELVERIAAIENTVGIKEESHEPDLTYRYNRLFHEKIVVIGGAGGMGDYLSAYQWGQPAYLAGIGSFAPEIELEFFCVLKEGDYIKAQCIVSDKEEPFFETAMKTGWHLALKEAMEQLGLMAAWERKPIVRLVNNEAQMVRKALRLSGILDGSV